jgi:hypothetical protein
MWGGDGVGGSWRCSLWRDSDKQGKKLGVVQSGQKLLTAQGSK